MVVKLLKLRRKLRMIKILLWILKNRNLNQKDHKLVINYLASSINSLPIKDVITFDIDGTVRINGKNLSLEQSIVFRESIVSLKENWAYKVIREQTAFEAIKIGIHTGNTLEQILFPKAVLWMQAQEVELINSLGGKIDQNV